MELAAVTLIVLATVLCRGCHVFPCHGSPKAIAFRAAGSGGGGSGNLPRRIRTAVGQMYADVQSGQWQHSEPYGWPITFGHEAGKYSNNIHVNFVGPMGEQLREALSFPDNNGFVTVFILDALLQTTVYGSADSTTGEGPLIELNDTSAQMALASLFDDRDKNQPDPKTPIFGFWPQKFAVGRRDKHNDLRRRVGSGDKMRRNAPRAHVLSSDEDHGATTPPTTATHNGNGFGYWQQWSINLSPASLDGLMFDAVVKYLLDKANLAWLYNLIFPTFDSIFDNILTMFNIPSDADDTGTMLALSRWLLWHPEVRQAAPATVALWNEQQFNATAAWDTLLRYRYCPLARATIVTNESWLPPGFPTSKATIDARSYAWAHPFFKTLQSESECLVTTWTVNLHEQVSRVLNLSFGPEMPFNVNNVDPTVTTNALLGLVSQLIAGGGLSTTTTSTSTSSSGRGTSHHHHPVDQQGSTASFREWFANSAEMQATFLASVKFVSWSLANSSQIPRQDVEMLYYPAVINLPYFVARLFRLLDDHFDDVSPLAPGLFQTARALLRSSVRLGGGTQYVLGRMEDRSTWCANAWTPRGDAPPSLRSSSLLRGELDEMGAETTYACWDGFLGHADATLNGTLTPHYQDRFYTTAVAVNALLEAWTYAPNISARRQLCWAASTPMSVRTAVDGGVNWLLDAYLVHGDTPLQYENTFFSGSIHNLTSLPFFSPPNMQWQLNNLTQYNCAESWYNNMIGDDTLWAVAGIMPDGAWQRIVQDGQCAGGPIDVSNATAGYNSPISPWPYWSSPALSKAFAMAAMAKYFSVLHCS